MQQLLINSKLAWRNIKRNKIYSIINIMGLAIGMTCVILISFYVEDELSYDRFLNNADRIYQVNLNGDFGGDEFLTSNTPPTVGAALADAFPEIESYTRIYRPGNTIVRYEGDHSENYFDEKRILAVDSSFLQIFSYPMLEGNAATCLQNPNSIVVTEAMAKKYFGDQEPMGETLLLNDNRTPFTVTGVLKDVPTQSSLQFDFLTSIAAYPVVKHFSWSWVWLQVATYVKLRDNFPNDAQSIAQLQSKFPSMVKQQAATAFKRIGEPLDELYKKGGKWDFYLQPMTSVHLYSANIPGRITNLSNITYIYIFSAIALFIIILACVNFMNLATAQSTKRAREVGVRKVLGSLKEQLVKQFLTEALMYSFISILLATLLVIVLIGPFNEFSGKSLHFSLFFNNGIWIAVILLAIITGLLSGSYPAFYLTAFKPVVVLKNVKSLDVKGGNQFIRNGLVVLQFAISTALIICTLVVFRQLQFTQDKDLGLDKENVVVISNTNRLGNSEETFRDEVAKLPQVIDASISTSIPTQDVFGDNYVPEMSSDDEPLVKELALNSFMVDENFIPTLQIKMAEGRNFSRDFQDSASVILNETAAKQIAWKDPIGKFITYPGNNNQRFKVIGVFKDFDVESIRYATIPFALFHSSSKTYSLSTSYTSVRIQPGDINQTLGALKTTWAKFSQETPFCYEFLNSDFEGLYQSEQRMGSVFGLFTFLSLFIACLGLFGLSAYTAERRTKEIGIRKVLGATVSNVTALLSKDFVRLIIIAILIATPIAWWAMNRWLNDFAYRIPINIWVFIVAGSIALSIALITVSFQSVRAAIANPVKSLRSE